MQTQRGEQDVQAVDRLLPGLRGYERRFERAVPLIDGERIPHEVAADAIPESIAPASVRRRDAIYRRALAASDALVTTIALFLAVVVIGDDRLTAAAIVVVPLIVLGGKVVGLYDRDQHLIRRTTLDEIPALFQVATLFTLVAWFGESLYVDGAVDKTQMFALWLMLSLAMALGRDVVRQVVKRATHPERCLVIGDAEVAARLQHKFDMSYSMRAEVVGRIPFDDEADDDGDGPAVLGSLALLPLVLETHDVERVIVAPDEVSSEAMLDTIRRVKSQGPKVSVVPRLLDVVGSSVEFDDVDGVTVLGLRGFGLSHSSQIVKRGTDVVGSLLVLALIAPLMAMIAAAVKLSSPGPVFFRQRRVGRDGQAFEMLKFRTMVDGADRQKPELAAHNEAADGLFKIADDPRLTRVGRFLRRASLDELPQLFNVLKGEMSLVGPRPLVVDEDRSIKGWERQRLNVAPGMTGFWQILGSSRVPKSEMVKIDYLYGANWSLWLDVKILLRTIPHVLARRGL